VLVIVLRADREKDPGLCVGRNRALNKKSIGGTNHSAMSL
jgi:hypothetical protein